ncbi:flagellar biosynthetic protein FliO [Paenibacillus humicola]|uniref:flagellar biosynthetic protein FliO n=1 Tax=Paenibacillus humicola TaxID=3110540 RepID=UPI00237AA8A8|nr:flagellar biosynthetic protein FliO [Paenibacillus humicola]
MRTSRLGLAGLAAAGWLQAGKAAAAAPDSSAPSELGPGTLDGGITAGYLIWVVVALMLVLGLIVLLLKFLSSRNRGWSVSRSLRLLGGVPLGPNKSMQVVELAGRVYVVGVGDSIALLDKIDDAEEAGTIIRLMDQQLGRTWNPQSMAAFLGRFRKRQADAGAERDGERWPEAASFQELLSSKLKSRADRKAKLEELLNEQNQNDRLLDE